jgi:hypothetical protein
MSAMPGTSPWQKLAQPVARAADGEALVVQQVADAPDQQHLVVLVVAPVAAPLHRLELGELLLPVAQHIRLDAAQLAHLTDGEVALGRNGGSAFSIEINGIKRES